MLCMHYHCICQSAHWMIKYDNLLCYMRALEFCLLRSAIVVLGHVVMPSFTQDSLFILCGRQPIRRVLHHVHHISFKRLVNNLTTVYYTCVFLIAVVVAMSSSSRQLASIIVTASSCDTPVFLVTC